MDGPVKPEGSPDKYVELILACSPDVQAKIDAVSGEFELTLPQDLANVFGGPLTFHPAEFDPGEIKDETLRASISDSVELAWGIMRDEFRSAIQGRRCLVFARAGSVLSPFAMIPPDVFRYFDMIHWRTGEATTPAGEKLFSLHVAPPEAEASVQDPQTRAGQRTCPSRQIMMQRAKAAIADLRNQNIPVDKMRVEELHRIVGRWCKEKNLETPSRDTVARAAGRRRSRK